MILCSKIIWLPNQEGHANTYCMREHGHKGKCNIENCEPPEEKKEQKVQTLGDLTLKEQILKKYGPYDKDDPRSSRGF